MELWTSRRAESELGRMLTAVELSPTQNLMKTDVSTHIHLIFFFFFCCFLCVSNLNSYIFNLYISA